MGQGKKSASPEHIKLSAQEVDALQQRIEKSNLPNQDIKLLLGLLAFNQWLQERLSRAKLTIKRLRQIFGFKNERVKKKNKVSQGETAAADTAQSKDTTTESLPDAVTDKQQLSISSPDKQPNWSPDKNHGRQGADDYSGCTLHKVAFDDAYLRDGFCPECAAHQTKAHVYSVKPKVVVLLEGQPLVSGQRYRLDKVRCTVCQTYFTAALPTALESRPKYSASCITSIALTHYYAGQPFHRIEMLQAAQGVPLADSTQYDLMRQLYQTAVAPIVGELTQAAANGKMILYDDTRGRILNGADPDKGQSINAHTTVLLSEALGHRIYLFCTNKLTAGKQLKKILSHRTCTNDFMTMSDASASNFPLLEENLLARWIILLCLSHSRRQFVELLEDGDEDIALVLDCIAQVYRHDQHCKQHKLCDDERLRYHQQHSAPVMEGMRIWLNNLLLYQRVEPNSRFGEAIAYLLKRWEWLTQFLRVPGAAIDNNLCEQAVKIVIRYRNNSLFYRTQFGAEIGDAMMSVIHTARHTGVNIFDYLNTLQTYAEEVQQSPQDWLPWNYQETLALISIEKRKIA